ncbi:MAG: sugar ABC transporter permease [Chloroflexota bacterium]
MTAISTPSAKQNTRSAWRRQEELTAWLFASPALILLSIFLILPFLMAIGFSFTDQRLVPNPNLSTQFVAIRNYTRLFEDQIFQRALAFTFLFVIIVVPLQTFLALLLAIFVNQKLPQINLFRAIYFVPVTLMMVVVTIIWAYLLNPSQGLINEVLFNISGGFLTPDRFPILNWTQDNNGARASIIILSMWQGVGFQMVIYLAGLQEIPRSTYEAAEIDGANKVQQFFYVTIPMLRNTTIFVVIATTILAFGLFDQVQVMTQGGPRDATQTMILYLYTLGFTRGRVGLASALGTFYFILVLVIALIQRRIIAEERQVQ